MLLTLAGKFIEHGVGPRPQVLPARRAALGQPADEGGHRRGIQTSGGVGLTPGEPVNIHVGRPDLHDDHPRHEACALRHVLARREGQPTRWPGRAQRAIRPHPLAAQPVALRPHHPVGLAVGPPDLML
jgi:hypothetical protein